MIFIKNISVILISFVVFLSSNGFILERYLCFDCESEHKEVAFFEFGELKHEHNSCADCAEHGHACDCSQKGIEHKENSDVTYYALEILYSDNTKTDIVQPLVQDIDDLGFDIWQFFIPNISDNQIITLLKRFKTPPILSLHESNSSFCSMLSVFRL